MNQSRIEGQVAVIQALPEPSLLVTGEGLICAANSPMLRILGLPAPAVQGHPLAQFVTDPPDKLNLYLQTCARSRQPMLGALTFPISHQDTLTYRCEGTVVEPRTPISPALVLLRLRPQESAASRFLLLNHTIADLHQEIRERRQAEARLRLLAEISTTLATSFEHRTIRQLLVEQLVGHYADWGMVFLVEANGHIARVATAHVDPTKMELARRLSQRAPSYPVPAPFVQVIATGHSLFQPDYDEAAVFHGIMDAEHLALIRRIGPRSVMVVPLQARGQTLGCLALVWSESDRHYSKADLEFAEELARRAALVVENARLYQETRTAELQLREFNQMLEGLVAERTQELERSNHELDQFAYVASHDLKAPLRAIKLLADWLVQDAGEALPPVAQEHIGRMQRRIARMERLLDDLLTYARAGRQQHAPEAVDSAALVRSVIELLAPPPGFTITVADTLPVLHTERVPLETVFRNLLNNAIKHHHQPTLGQVRVTAQVEGNAVEFAIHDNGPGIDPRFHVRIFEIFQTLQLRDQVEGSGIGLAVVKKIVEHRGGTIRVDSEVGQGTTFYFTWPTLA